VDGSYGGSSAPLDVPLLTAAELRLAAAIVAGKTNAEIATAFALSVASVEVALAEVCRKLGVSSRTELAVLLGALAEASRGAAQRASDGTMSGLRASHKKEMGGHQT